MDVSKQLAEQLTADTGLWLIGAYIHHIRHHGGLRGTKVDDQTLRLMIDAAGHCFTLLQQKHFEVHDPKTLQSVNVKLHPFLAEQVRQVSTWKQPKDRYEPFTCAILEVLSAHSQAKPPLSTPFLSRQALVYDTSRLGAFTGSRVSEYAQAKLTKGKRWMAIPDTADAGAWAGKPMAFLREDFTFYTSDLVECPWPAALPLYRANLLEFVRIRFRFDKSPRNFSMRKFRRTSDVHLCPVDACVSLCHRADILKVPLLEPVCAFKDPKSKFPFDFLRDYHITSHLRDACVQAYPDPNHYLRKNIKGLVPHSNRVMAALCLTKANVSRPEIAYKLRWHESSVPTYLRDCFQDVGTQCDQVVTGAWLANNTD